MMVLFKELEVVQKDGQERWKPFQTGAILSTTSVLDMEKYYLEEKFKFLLISRFSQDSLENLFSVVRFRQSVLTALEFKNNLKLITIAQFMTKSTSTNYEQDDRELLSGFLNVISESPPKPAVHTITIPKDWDKNLTELSLLE
ncbi:hypothetical protein JTE90_024391 [Oedothorax gibbosus]|uniref:Uncharacterized protein n=1 Tax=Oedothorax gibbosus TaxID=931172 RepID=A0AAV6TST6_9ARAC|nr:hypothetical protein JTE90_024391 [Oedothorax gibbosus]